MPHKINYNSKSRIIEVKVKEKVTIDELKEIYFQGVQLAKEIDCFLILGDFRKATTSHLTMLEISSLPQILAELSASMGINANGFKRAIVVAHKDIFPSSFAQGVTLSQGQNAKMFQNITEARKWLLEE